MHILPEISDLPYSQTWLVRHDITSFRREAMQMRLSCLFRRHNGHTNNQPTNQKTDMMVHRVTLSRAINGHETCLSGLLTPSQAPQGCHPDHSDLLAVVQVTLEEKLLLKFKSLKVLQLVLVGILCGYF